MFPCSLSSVERESGEVGKFTVWVQENGAQAARLVITEMEMGFIEAQRHCDFCRSRGHFSQHASHQDLNTHPITMCLKLLYALRIMPPVHYPHRSQWRSMLGKQSPFLIYLFNRVVVETIAVNSMTKSRPIQTKRPGICLTRAKVICISSMYIQIVFKV